jgi:hypothetical protein
MSRGAALVLAFLMICSKSLAAQASLATPDPPLDPARASLRDALLLLRDSLVSVDGAAARLQRDFRASSEASLLSRARVMHEACARSSRAVPPARGAVVSAKLSGPRKAKLRSELLRSMDRLHAALTRCENEFAQMSRAGQGEQVRGYGNNRADQAKASIRQYEETLGKFFGALGIKVRPSGPA